MRKCIKCQRALSKIKPTTFGYICWWCLREQWRVRERNEKV